MNQKGSISRSIELAREGDQKGIATLYNRFQSQLIGWANRKLDSSKCRAFDAEDVAIEAFHAFCLGIENGSFPEIENRHGLRALLATIAIRKAINRIDQANTYCRGGGKIHGESMSKDIGAVQQDGMNPDEQAILDDEVKRYLKAVPEKLRDILELSIQGYSSSEIATELNCSTRSIQLKKKQIVSLLTNEGK